MMHRSPQTLPKALIGWNRSPRAERGSRRDVLPPIAAIAVITLGLVFSGAVPPLATLALSSILILIAMASLITAGPGGVTTGMLAGVAMLGIAAMTGLAGPLHTSGPVLAAVLAAGAAWTIGYLAAKKCDVLETIWSTLIWAGTAYCVWIYVACVSTIRGQSNIDLARAFGTPANTSLVFGLLAVIATGRLLRIMKQIDAENLGYIQAIERLLHDGVGALLLLFASLGLLVLVGSEPGMMFTGAVILAFAWWDSLSITTRDYHGLRTRILVIAIPLLALFLAGWGVWQGWTIDDTISAGIGDPDRLTSVQRREAYGAAWLESPITGHGLGSAISEGARFHTLHNAKAMLAPGGPQNLVISWLVETGILGLVLFTSVFGAIHVRIATTLTKLRAPRSFPRMAIAASTLLLLHGVAGSSIDIAAVGWLYAFLLGCACGLAAGQAQKSH